MRINKQTPAHLSDTAQFQKHLSQPALIWLLLHAQTCKRDLVDRLCILGLSISYDCVLHCKSQQIWETVCDILVCIYCWHWCRGVGCDGSWNNASWSWNLVTNCNSHWKTLHILGRTQNSSSSRTREITMLYACTNWLWYCVSICWTWQKNCLRCM